MTQPELRQPVDVNDALARLDDLPVDDHAAAYAVIIAELHEALASIAEV